MVKSSEYEELLPRHPDDQARLERLEALELEERVPLIPHLLVWLKEEEQPITAKIADLLLPCEYDLLPHLRNVLQAEEGHWKRSVFRHLLNRLPKDVSLELVSELIALVMNPTENDLDAEIDELSEELLSTLLEGR
jgi:hypothetical protein